MHVQHWGQFSCMIIVVLGYMNIIEEEIHQAWRISNWREPKIRSSTIICLWLRRTKDKFHHQYHFMVMGNIYNCGRKLAWGTICHWREKNSIFNFHLLVIEDNQRQSFSFINNVMGNIHNWGGKLKHSWRIYNSREPNKVFIIFSSF